MEEQFSVMSGCLIRHCFSRDVWRPVRLLSFRPRGLTQFLENRVQAGRGDTARRTMSTLISTLHLRPAALGDLAPGLAPSPDESRVKGRPLPDGIQFADIRARLSCSLVPGELRVFVAPSFPLL